MTENIRLGIVGTGRMASRMMQALAMVPDFSVAAVASGSSSRARDFADSFGISQTAGSAAGLSERAGVDAVYVCGRSGRHAADALAALGAGKPVLLEKPLATSLTDAQSLADKAKSAGVLLMENLWCLALPSYRRLSESLASQSFGTPVHLQFDFGYPVTADAYPSLFDPEDGGALLDRGVYGVSLALHLLGPVRTVHCTSRLDDRGVDLTSALTLGHESGATSQIAVSLTALMSNTASLSCTHGYLQLGAPVVGSESLRIQQTQPETTPPAAIDAASGGLKSKLKSNPVLRRLKRLRDASAAQFIPNGPDQYAPVLTHFRDLIRKGASESPLIPLDLSLATQDVLEQARRQGRGV